VIPSLEALDWHRFLARPTLLSPAQHATEALRHRSILVTGAGGSIGSALALRLASLAPRQLVLLESSESQLYALQNKFAEAGLAESATCVLGSIGDSALLDEVYSLYAPRLVFHAAAFKHVPLLEEQPLAAIENNILGTNSLFATAAKHGACVVLLSTDKAVEPVSVMGATKRVAEHIALSAGGTVLRLGNVLASSDSVAEIFARQIAGGGPLTVTDPGARRYFLTVSEAVDCLIAAATEPEAPVLLAPAFSAAHFIADLARFMACELNPGREIAVEFTRPRPGDKEAEKLWSSVESVRPAKTPGLLVVQSPGLTMSELRVGLDGLRAILDIRDLSAALAQLRSLVPDYIPSPAVAALAGRSALRVTP
jgi:O-antigen biosynthesis protein WbqV